MKIYIVLEDVEMINELGYAFCTTDVVKVFSSQNAAENYIKSCGFTRCVDGIWDNEDLSCRRWISEQYVMDGE